MNRKHRSVNPRRASDEAAREQLGRLRDAINTEQYWVIAVDHDQLAFAVHALAGLLVISGAPARELILIDVDARVLDRARRHKLTVLAVAKHVLSLADFAAFIAGLTRSTPAAHQELVASLQGGRDLVPLGRQPDQLAEVLHGIRNDLFHNLDPAIN